LVVASAAASATADEGAPVDLDQGWIDAHVHVWTPDTQRYPLAPGFTTDAMVPASFTPTELFAHCRPSNVSRVVLIQMSFYGFDNRYMLDMIAQYPGVFAGIGIVDPDADDLPARMRALAAAGVRGFRIHARGDAASGWVNDPGMARLWRTAREEGLAVCPLINPTDLAAIDALCTQYPETTVVIDHFARIGIGGTIDPNHLDQLLRLARFKDVYVKTSAFYALGRKRPPYQDLLPMIRQLVQRFGPERLMWASDCPYQVQGQHRYDASVALIRDRADFLSASDKTQILRGTADKLFFR
jgi:predicted TIM-barrel fold metal-dependent hydrolase